MPDHLVSVVIPTYNYGPYVTAAVDSALSQTYRRLEVLVVDDGSTDDTEARLAGYGSRIRYLRQLNQGLSAARNTGIRAARGDYVALLDSDDAWHPQKVEAQLAYLDRHPGVGVLGSDATLDLPAVWGPIAPQETPPACEVSLRDLLVASRFSPSSAVISRRCFEEVGDFNPALRAVEDRDYWLRAACHFAIHKLLMPLTWSRVHTSNMSKDAVRMEHFESVVLRNIFASSEQLLRRRLLRQKAFACAAYRSALNYTTAGCQWAALRRIVQSLLRWPVPFRREDSWPAFGRPKSLVLIALRLLHLKPPPAS
jgi:glycosyltransferase involved in cell wall biosynthesis